uniref:Uncharacterized protein n=1 Tax=Cyprinus carpio carpio TaxID=630221 RepID=A0A9J7ZMT1_CYPCA
MTSPEPRWSMTSLESRWSETSLESRRSAISPEPNRSMTSSEPQLQDESQRQPGTTLSGFAPLLHRLLTNQEMMMDQLKVILKTMQKMGEPARGQEPLERDILPLKRSYLPAGSGKKRLREEADLKNKMITALSVIGGVDIKDSVWRVMKHCFYQLPCQTTQLAWHQWQNSFPQTAAERCHHWNCQKQQANSDSHRSRDRILY